MKACHLLAVSLLVASISAHAAVTVQAYYRMGDNGKGASDLPVDSSGNGRNFTGTIDSSITAAPTTGGGYNNDAYYSFNGTNDGFYNTIGSYNPPEDNIGIEVWGRIADLAQTGTHLFGTSSNASGLNIGYDAGGGIGWFGAIASVAYVGSLGTANYAANNWIHLALVRSGGVTTFYINGVPSGTSTGTPIDATGTGSGALHMGVNSGGSKFFKGDLAEARIFTFQPGAFQTSDLLFPAVPEPGIAVLGVMGLIPLIRRRRSA